MPPVVIEVSKAADRRDVVHRAVQALVEGELVVFPTETVYGVAASALSEAGTRRLLELKSRPANQPMTLSIRSAADANDYVPAMLPLAKRLARRCWPGPITLVMADNHPDSLLRQLPEPVQQVVCPEGNIGLRVPAHQLLLDVMDLLAGPVLLTSANRAGQPPANTADEAVAGLGDDVRLFLDDGPARFGEASSVVKVGPSGLNILRAGVLNEDTLKRLSAFIAVVVCTGNTCRSPMGEALLRRRLAEKLGCEVDALEDRGVVVMSAGVAAMPGSRASTESVEVMKSMDIDINDHASQPVTDRLVRHADLILTMTNGHRAALLNHWPEASNRTHVLCKDGRDVSDPIGGPMDLYRRCAEQIDEAIQERVDDIDLDQLVS